MSCLVYKWYRHYSVIHTSSNGTDGIGISVINITGNGTNSIGTIMLSTLLVILQIVLVL